MHHLTRRAALAPLPAMPARAQAWPERPITLVIPFASGPSPMWWAASPPRA